MIPQILGNIVMIAAAFYIITKAADFFIDEAATIGRHHGLSKIMIGLTIVAVGTSLPEMFTSLVSIMFTENHSDFIIGTIMGSNISNILLVFGAFLIFSKGFTIKKDERLNVSIMLFMTMIFLAFVILGFVNYFAIILVIIYVIYIAYLARYRTSEIIKEEDEIIEFKRESLIKSYSILVATVVGLVLGTKMVVTGIENLGMLLQIPLAYLTLTVIAAATSFPEVAVSIASARKKEYLLGIGNVIGSNIINIGLIFGASGFFGFYNVMTAEYVYSITFLAFATALFSVLILGKKFIRSVGWMLVLMYGLYLATFFI